MSDPDRRTVATVFTGGVVLVAVGVLVWAIPPAFEFATQAPSGFWAIALLGVLVDVPILALVRRVAEPTRTTLSVCFTFAIFLLWGAAPAIVVQAVAAGLGAAGQRRSPRSSAFLVARLVCALAAAEVVVAAAHQRPLTRPGTGLTGNDVIGFLLPATVWFVVSFGLLAAGRAVVWGGGLLQAVSGMREDVFATAASMLLVSPLLTTLHGWWSALVAVPLVAWNQLSREYTRREQRLRREPVTGLLNRRGLILGTETLIGEEVLNPERQRPFGVIIVNVESVLAVNRTLGRDLYERVVAAAGRRLAEEFGSDRVGRLSGEAFVILWPGLTEDGAVPEAVRAVALLAPPVEVEQIPFALEPAAGVALSPPHGRDFATLVAKAELAMGEARRLSVPATLYARQALDVAQHRIAILAELRAALTDPDRQDEVAVVYQPQVDLRTGQLVAAEALVRWTHPQWGPVAPDELIEAVEPSEIMHMLTRHMLDQVGLQLREWSLRGVHLRVAVNASVRDLHDSDFPSQISSVLTANGIPPDRLTIEITERMLIDDADRVGRAAAKIAALGVGLSLDDFGTGYASIHQLQVLPLTEVKIDKSYVSGMTASAAERAIVTGVHQLARALDLDVVAEGVEDEPTAAALAVLPGTIGQGWYFGRPVPPAVFDEQWHGGPQAPA